jgi:large subunit ribosomal protein L35
VAVFSARSGPISVGRTALRGARAPTESKMPKMKTKSGAKKRFKITGTGKVLYAQRGKRHGMIKRTKKQIRNLRGTAVLFKSDGDNVKKYFLPND